MITSLFSNPLAFVIYLVVILASLSLHEFSHALVGTLQGDETAKRMGRLTLNPIAHIDLIGLLALVTIGFGWGKPVPFNPYNLKNQKWGPVFVAFAGPAANVILVIVSGLALKAVLAFTALGADNALVVFLSLMMVVNTALFFFNLIPIPPLDGSKLLLSALSAPQYARARMTLETRGPIILLMLILADAFLFGNLIFGSIFGFLINGVVSLFGVGRVF